MTPIGTSRLTRRNNMEKTIITSGKTIELAVEAALAQLDHGVPEPPSPAKYPRDHRHFFPLVFYFSYHSTLFLFSLE